MTRQELKDALDEIYTHLHKAERLLDEIDEEQVPIDWRSEFRDLCTYTADASFECYCIEGGIDVEEEAA